MMTRLYFFITPLYIQEECKFYFISFSLQTIKSYSGSEKMSIKGIYSPSFTEYHNHVLSRAMFAKTRSVGMQCTYYPKHKNFNKTMQHIEQFLYQKEIQLMCLPYQNWQVEEQGVIKGFPSNTFITKKLCLSINREPLLYVSAIAKTCNSGSLFMDNCNLLVINLFTYTTCMEDVQY